MAIAQRKNLLFSAIWYPALTALGGSAHLVMSLLLREPLNIGIGFIIIGSVLTLLMWLATLGKRNSSRNWPPRSILRDIRRSGLLLLCRMRINPTAP